MSAASSLRSKLNRLSVIYLLLILSLGAFSLWRLLDYGHVTGEIQGRFLPNTRYLGDLNNYTSDFRAAEATGLLARTPDQTQANLRTAHDLDRLVRMAQVGYRSRPHTPAENARYARFSAAWNSYEGLAWQVLTLAARGQIPIANQIYLDRSRAAYDAASNALGALTDENVTEAGHAVGRADDAFYVALMLICVAGICAGIMTLGVTAYMRRSISEPLLGLAGSMRRLAANQMDIDLHDTDRRDEIGEMARAVSVFRDNAAELVLSQRALAEQAGLLEEKLAFEQRMALAQRNFVSMASHEFRTPLTLIDGHAQRLLKGARRLTPEDIVGRATRIRHAVLRMTHVIDNLLNSGRLLDNDTQLYLHPEIIDLKELLTEVCRLHREVNPKAIIREEYVDYDIKLPGDPRLLFQAFGNLVSNAIKYGGSPAVLQIRIQRIDDHVRIQIEDNGIGIAEADVPQIFERYFRGANAGGAIGTGVGLFLAKTVVNLHSGSLSVESALGEGSTFSVDLPYVLRDGIFQRTPPPAAGRAGPVEATV